MKNKKTTTGFAQTIHLYQAQNCEGCPLRGVCHKGRGNRVIEVSHNLNRLRLKADARLRSEEGIRHRKKRLCDVEPVFGNIKQNHHFRRFMLRGLKKARVETGLLALAHNLRKKATPRQAKKSRKPTKISPKQERFRAFALCVPISAHLSKNGPLSIAKTPHTISPPVAA